MDIKEQLAYDIGDAVMKLPLYSTPIEDSKVLIGKTVIPLVRADMQSEIGDWLKGTCQCRVPFHARWHCAICKNRLLVSLKSGTFKEIEEIG